MSDTSVTIRRWIDRALVGSIAALVAFVGLIYGGLARGQTKLEEQQREDSKRLTIAEQQIQSTSKMLEEIRFDVKLLLKRDNK